MWQLCRLDFSNRGIIIFNCIKNIPLQIVQQCQIVPQCSIYHFRLHYKPVTTSYSATLLLFINNHNMLQLICSLQSFWHDDSRLMILPYSTKNIPAFLYLVLICKRFLCKLSRGAIQCYTSDGHNHQTFSTNTTEAIFSL